MSDNKLFLIAIGLIVVVVIFIAILVLSRGFGGEQGRQANLEFWGVFDESSFYRDVVDAFQTQYPNIRIQYRRFTFDEYERRLLEAFAAGRGPDIWMIHNTWLPKHQDKISPLPLTGTMGRKEPPMTLRNFRDQFVEVAEKDLVLDGQIYALPIYIDTLAMYYNRDILNSAGITTPPSTWDGFNQTITAITRIGDLNNIIQSGAAMGTARNINRSTDILSLLMLQSGIPIVEGPLTGASLSQTVSGRNIAEVALEYYTDFANPRSPLFTWNSQMDYSIDAFRDGKTAIMFNYSHHVATLRAQAPRFNFDVAPMPQIAGSVTVNYPNYWAPTVSRFTEFSEEAWEFLVFLSSNDGATRYINASGRPPARRDLIDAVRNHPDIGVFAVQTLSARSWYQVDNLAIEDILAEVIEDVNLGRRSIRDAIRFAENQINLLIQRR